MTTEEIIASKIRGTIGENLAETLPLLRAVRERQEAPARELEKLLAEAADVPLSDLLTAPGLLRQIRQAVADWCNLPPLACSNDLQEFATAIDRCRLNVGNAVREVQDAERAERDRLARLKVLAEAQVAAERQQAADAREAELLAAGDEGAFRRWQARQQAAAPPTPTAVPVRPIRELQPSRAGYDPNAAPVLASGSARSSWTAGTAQPNAENARVAR